MTFHWPHLLWLTLLPVLLFIGPLFGRKKHQTASHSRILQAETRGNSIRVNPASTAVRRPGNWRMSLGLLLVVVALARPQWGKIEEPVFEQSREILVAIDLSRSMLADDIKPSRLERARLLTQSLLGKLNGERIGLVAFAGTAFLQSPLSSDYAILRQLLNDLNTDYIPEGGTNYKALLETSLDSYSDVNADRFLIVLSDGESQTDDWQPAAEKLKEKGIKVISLGIGTTAGAMIPDGKGGLVKDERGAVVLSKLAPSTLQSLAQMTGGVYADASQWVDLDSLIKATVDQGLKGKFTESREQRLSERFQWALAPGILFIMWSLLSEFPVTPRPRKIRLRPSAKTASVMAGFLIAGLSLFSPPGLRAQSPDTNQPEDKTLLSVVEKLAGKDSLSTGDFAELARTTIAYGEQMKSAGKPLPGGLAEDALDAIDQGRKIDSHAADWNNLEKQIRQLEQPPPPPPKTDDQKQDSSKSEDQKNSDSDKKDQKSGQSKSGSDSKNSSQDEQKNNSGSNKKSESGKDQQSPPQSDSQGQKSQPEKKPGQDSSSSQNPSQSQQKGEGDQKNAPPPDDKTSDSKGQQAFSKNDNQDKPNPDKKDSQPAFSPADKNNKQPSQSSPGDNDQIIGGASTGQNTQSDNRDPRLVVPLQQLQRVKEKDSPARLFQLMQEPDQNTPPPKGRDW